ncbi:MAG: ABC-2 family transporter protein, partial [Oscillospiraceae bacterium]
LLFASGLVFIMAATTFKWVGNSRIFEIYDSLTILGRYPGTIYHKLLMNITIFVFPVAAMGFFPAASLLGRSQPWMYWAFMPALLFFLLGLWLFRKMIRLYQSAGG